MIATSKISTQGLQINNSSGGNNKFIPTISSNNIIKNVKRNSSKNVHKPDNDMNKLNDYSKISLDFENNFLKNLGDSYKESINILNDTYKNSVSDLDNSYKSSIQNLENTYNISKKNLSNGYNKSKKILETNFDTAFTYLKTNFEIKQKLDREKEKQIRRDEVEKKNQQNKLLKLNKEQKYTLENDNKQISWNDYIEKRKEQISNDIHIQNKLEKSQIQKEIKITNQLKKNNIIESIPDISEFFLHKKIDSDEYKYALNIYSGIDSAKTQLYKNNRPSISYTDDLEMSQGYINWKNVEYITNSTFIMFVLYSNECKNDELQTELIKKNFLGNVKVSDLKVLDTKFEYCKNPTVIINEQEIKFQYQILLKCKVDKKIELNSNINISWLLEF